MAERVLVNHENFQSAPFRHHFGLSRLSKRSGFLEKVFSEVHVPETTEVEPCGRKAVFSSKACLLVERAVSK